MILKYRILAIILILLLNGCSEDDVVQGNFIPNGSHLNYITSFAIPNADSTINAIVDNELNKILFEVPPGMNIQSLAPSIKISQNAIISPKSGKVIDFFNGAEFIVTAENGMGRTYNAGFYTSNLLKNPQGLNDGEFWQLRDSEVRFSSDTGYFFYSLGKEDNDPIISQTIDFNRDYSGKYVLFVANMWKDRVVEGSISGDPYIWAVQRGDFDEDDWPYLQGMGHHDEKNTWKVVYGARHLLDGITSMYFTMQQGRGRGPFPEIGTPNKILTPEMRVFATESDAEYYVEKIYEQL